MASKYRPRNPLKPTTGPRAAKCPIPTKQHHEFTGIGEESISGEGGGRLRFKDGKFQGAGMVTFSRKWTPEDSVHSVWFRAQHGLSPDKSESAELAASLLDAVRTGDAEIFRRISKVLRNPGAHREQTGLFHDTRDFELMEAVTEAARRANGVPTIQAVGKLLYTKPSADGGGHLFTTAKRAGKVREMLAKIGFGWLPGKKRGEHLRKGT